MKEFYKSDPEESRHINYCLQIIDLMIIIQEK